MRYPGGMSAGRIPDVGYPSGMSAEKNSGCETSGWNVGGEEFRMQDIRWNELCHASPGGRLRVQGRGSHAAIFREAHTYTWVLTMS